MKLFECMIDLNGTWRKVQVHAECERSAYEQLCAQYGDDVVKGYPSEVRAAFWG